MSGPEAEAASPTADPPAASPPSPARRLHPALVAVLLVAFVTLGGTAVVLLTTPAPTPDVPVLAPYANDLTDPPTLLANEVAALDTLSTDIESLTSAEIAVLLVDTTQPWGINAFAAKTFELNGIGKAGLDNGLLVLVSVGEGRWWIEVGYGLEGVLPDSRVGRLGDQFLGPNLTAGQYYEGIYGVVSAIGDVLVNEYEAVAPPPRHSGPVVDWASICLGALVLLSVAGVILVLMAWRMPRALRGTPGRGSGTGSSTRSYQSPYQPPTSSYSPPKTGGGSFGGGRSGGGGAGGKF